MQDFLADLNPEQRLAVTHEVGALLVLAGPGTGKTRVIAHRVAHSVTDRGVPPKRLLAITFTRRAAEEMSSRVDDLLGHKTRVPIGTFHWACSCLLRRHGSGVGLRPDFRVVSPRSGWRLAVSQTPALARVNSLPAVSSALSAVKNGGSVDFALDEHELDAGSFQDAARQYQFALASTNTIDLDDLVRLSVRLLRQHPGTRLRCARAHEEILVDEFQDVNPMQYALLQLLRSQGRNIVAVGDEDQAIYGWRQADGRHVLAFERDFSPARVVTLETTYRSTKHVLRVAGRLIAHNSRRHDKALRTRNPAGERPMYQRFEDEKAEAAWLGAEISRLLREGQSPAGVAVIYRINAQSRAIEEGLRRAAVPYSVLGGTSFTGRAEVRAVRAAVSFVLDASDGGAELELLRMLPGVGEGRLQRLRSRPGSPDLLQGAEDIAALLSPSVRSSLGEMRVSLQELVRLRHRPLPEVVDGAIGLVFSSIRIAQSPPDHDIDANFAELRGLALDLWEQRFGLVEFIRRLEVKSDAAGAGDAVRLMTLHAAKGLEFDAVFMPGLEEGLLPHRRALDSEERTAEERRLCYVGITRARRLLFLSATRQRRIGDGVVEVKPSRFLAEMGSVHLDRRSSPKPSGSPRSARVPVKGTAVAG